MNLERFYKAFICSGLFSLTLFILYNYFESLSFEIAISNGFNFFGTITLTYSFFTKERFCVYFFDQRRV